MRARSFDTEVLHARKYIRELGVNRNAEFPFVALDQDKTSLDDISLCYIENSSSNQTKYYSAFVNEKKISLSVMSITKADIDLTAATLDQLKNMLHNKIASLCEPFNHCEPL